MGLHPRIALIAGLASLAAGLGGCDVDTPPTLSPVVRRDEALPVDQVRPGELAEGEEDAFGLKLPRSMPVKVRFSDSVMAEGSVPAEHLAGYVRERVEADHVETGPTKTVFVGARAKAAGDAGAPRLVRVEIARVGNRSRLTVRDETPPPPPPPGTPEAEILKQVGLGPDGKPLDPLHAE